MKCIIAGGRDNRLSDTDYQELDRIPISEVVSGCARGIDTDGERYAFSRDIPVKRFPANWNKYGKSAGYIRNTEMAKYADALAIFKGGKGTKHMYNIAINTGLEIFDMRDNNE